MGNDKTKIGEKMITDVELNPLEHSNFIKLQQMKYKENNIEKVWHIAQAHDSVAVLVFNTDLQKYIIIKQFRPPVYLNREDKNGYTYELCAGIKDKIKPLSLIAAEEVFEELGYLVESRNLKKLTTVHTSVGTNGAAQTIYYIEVTNAQRIGKGGGIDDEQIEVLHLTRQEIMDLIKSDKPITCSLQLAVAYTMKG